MKRGFAYVSAFIVINLSQFMYIWIQVFLMQKPLLEQGGPLFLTFTFFDMGVYLGLYFLVLNNGAQANSTDYDFK